MYIILLHFTGQRCFFQRVTRAASSLSIISLNRSSMSSDLCTVSILTSSITLCSTAMSLVGSNSLQALQRCVHYTFVYIDRAFIYTFMYACVQPVPHIYVVGNIPWKHVGNI